MKSSLIFKKDGRNISTAGLIQVRIFWNGNRCQFGTGYSLEAKHWDTTTKHVKTRGEITVGDRGNEVKLKLKDIHADITRQQTDLEREWNRLRMIKKDEFTAAEFKSYLAGDLDPHQGTQMDFLPWVTKFVNEFDKTALPGQSKTGTEATRKKYQADLRILEQFSIETGEELSWSNMDHNFCQAMRDWRAGKAANYFRHGYLDDSRTSEGTVGRWVKTVRGWITRARSLGIHTFDHHKHPEWTVKEADVLRFALSEKQLQAFLDWEVPDTPADQGGAPRTGVKKARDLFCVQCTTGVRVSDLAQVIKQYNDNPSRETFSIHMKKTDAFVTVPVWDMVHKIAAKHGGQLPPTGALTRYNKLLRKGAKLSGLFDEKMLKPILDENGQRKMEEVDQWQLVTSHAARRTFATYLASKGIATRTIMGMTGHKVESEFNKYVNMNAVETALRVKELVGL